MSEKKIKEVITNDNISLLRKYQLVTLEILLEVDRICRKNNITYWIDAGTLLGAIRHGGFIPWDDDIDICIPRNDYNRFRKVIKEELNEIFIEEDKYSKNWVNSNCNYKFNWMKIYYLKYFKSNDILEDKEVRGTYIDIFPVDEVNKSMVNSKINRNLSKILSMSIKNNNSLKNKIRNLIQNLRFENLWIMKSRYLVMRNKAKYVIYGIETPFIDIKNLHKIQDLFPLKEIEFEGYKFYAPNNYDKYLTNLYGDYMKEEKYPPHNNNLRIEI